MNKKDFKQWKMVDVIKHIHSYGYWRGYVGFNLDQILTDEGLNKVSVLRSFDYLGVIKMVKEYSLNKFGNRFKVIKFYTRK